LLFGRAFLANLLVRKDVTQQRTVNPFVPGSSPGQGAKLCKDFLRVVLFFRLQIFVFRADFMHLNGDLSNMLTDVEFEEKNKL